MFGIDKCKLQSTISHRTRFERFRQKVTKVDTATWMGTVKKKKTVRNREDTKGGRKCGMEWQMLTSETRWRSEVNGSG